MRIKKAGKTKAVKNWTQMTAIELGEATKDLATIRYEDTRPMNKAERAQWTRTKRRRGRPLKAEKATRVLISVERTLLKEADALARSQGVSRSQLIAQGLKTLIRKAG